MKILSNVELKMSEKVKLAEMKVKENNVEFATTVEEYESLADKLERKIKQYMRKEALLKAKNNKLRVDLKKFKVWVLLFVLSLLVILFCVKCPFNRMTNKMLPGA